MRWTTSTGRNGYDLGNYHVLSHSNKDHHCIVDCNADIPVVFLMIKKIKIEDDDPDYRYWDFRDEIVQVERIRTITTGGKNGTKSKEESKKESKKTSNATGQDQETA
jgi:hypothetical protein